MIQVKALTNSSLYTRHMTHDPLLDRYGLFSARAPRYTSYPPANHFQPGAGQTHQMDWLRAIKQGEAISLYIHIPFCRRLCWFCACRTQGTQTLRPVEAYVETLLTELAATHAQLAKGVTLSRLHLGGGTPTILTPALMDRLLTAIAERFTPAPDYEFSVEIDPTEAAPELIATLARHGMARASIGVQDFAQPVQDAIGRQQSYELTRDVVATLRADGVQSLNMDLLYGLPHQTEQTLGDTLSKVIALNPDRIALYGYAHVPWMSKRQKLIRDDDLPTPHQRFDLSEQAKDRLIAAGYDRIGIDHFARPGDSMAKALRGGTLRRNFQGYTDDPADALVGLGASAISRFREGYVQNAVATAAYTTRVEQGGLAGDKGYALTGRDGVLGAMIESLMCYGHIDRAEITERFPEHEADVSACIDDMAARFGELTEGTADRRALKPQYICMSRIVAGHLDQIVMPEGAHSIAV